MKRHVSADGTATVGEQVAANLGMENKKLITVFYQQRTVPQGQHLINRRF